MAIVSNKPIRINNTFCFLENEEKSSKATKSDDIDIDDAVKSVLNAKLDSKQINEASDSSIEPETKENKELEAKLADLIKQANEITGNVKA